VTRTQRRLFGGLLAPALIAAAACAGVVTSERPAAPQAAARLSWQSVDLGRAGADLAPGVAYSGGLWLGNAELQGLSDLKIVGQAREGRITALSVSDFGALVQFDMIVDGRERLTSARGFRISALTDPQGQPLQPKARADAEGLAVQDDGSVLVSFEGEHRIWSYGEGGAGRPVAVRHPEVDFANNAGMEGLATAPDGGWLVLGEDGGAWVCDPTACRALPQAPTTSRDGYRFTGADRDPSGAGWYVVERAYFPPIDMRVRVRHMAADGTLGPVLIALKSPARVDNFEAIAARAIPGGTQIFILSDDKANPLQQTLLLSFVLTREVGG